MRVFFHPFLASVIIIFPAPSELHLQLRGKEKTIINHNENVCAFIAKIKLWKKKVSTAFHNLKESLADRTGELALCNNVKAHFHSLTIV